jgi:UDP:flavonoid glycosyltransferase YjiC (YdhE family)
VRWHLFCVGSRGDVQPFVALGRALVAAGQTVSLAALEPHRAFVDAHGLAFASLGPLPGGFAGPRRSPPFAGLAGRALFWAFYRRVLAGYLPRFAELAAGADALVFSGLAFPVHHLAERLDVPAFSVALVPHVPTRAFVDPFFAGHPLADRPWFRERSAATERALMLRLCAEPIARWRRSLGLPAIPGEGWLAHRERATTLELVAVSEHLLPRPRDWPAKVRLTGFWQLDDADAPAPVVADFLAAGRPAILVGFGSMSPGVATARYAAVLDAAAALDERVLVTAPAGPVDVDALARRAGLDADRYIRVDELAHAWVLPRVDLAIHHGGVGTLAAVVRAGVPSVVLPHDYDQFFWAERVEQLGVGVGFGRRSRVSATRIRRAILAARRPAIRARVAKLGERLAVEDGVGAATRLLLDA